MMKRLCPDKIIFYGSVPDDCKGDIIRIKPFSDKFNSCGGGGMVINLQFFGGRGSALNAAGSAKKIEVGSSIHLQSPGK